MTIRLLAILILLALAPTALAADDTRNAVYNERVRSLQLFEGDSPFAVVGAAAMTLGDDSGIRVEFDILADDRQYLRYSVTHCNADWRPSGLAYMEYVDGFNEGQVEDFAYSEVTGVHYVHYVIRIPDGQMRPLISGNYLLVVWDEGDGPGQPLLQCRFVVTEQTADVDGTVSGRTDVDYNRAHQQLALAVDTRRAGVRSPFSDLIVTVEQNGRPDNAVTLSRPLRVQGTTAIYEHDPKLVFKAGNEYRRFETSTLSYPGMGIESMDFVSPYYHATVMTDKSRANESYHYDETQNGAYTVREYNHDIPGSTLAADYVVTHFTLDYPETPGLSFFVDSDAFQRRFGPESMMRYNRGTGRYELATLLKQGQYSYQYLAVPVGATTGRTDVIEGDRFETRNLYRVYVYRRMPGDRYDRLIAVATLRYR